MPFIYSFTYCFKFNCKYTQPYPFIRRINRKGYQQSDKMLQDMDFVTKENKKWRLIGVLQALQKKN